MADKNESCEEFFIAILQALSFCTLLVSAGKYLSPQYYFYYLIVMVMLIMAVVALYTEKILPNVKENARRSDNLLEVDKPQKKQAKVSILVQDIDNPTYSRLESAKESYEIIAVRDIPRKTGKQELSYQKVKDYVENNNRFDEDVASGGGNLLTDGRISPEKPEKIYLSSKVLRKRGKKLKGLGTTGSSDTDEPSSSFLSKHLSRSFDNFHKIYKESSQNFV